MSPMPLRFTVLGEVRVWRGGAEVDPGPPLRRTLLALLLAGAGSPVPLPEIVEALWADPPPARAVNMVHRHVGELRRLLEPGLPNRAEGSLLLRGAGGYRLMAPPDSVDLLILRRLVHTAREALRRDDPERAVEVFADALALRRGPAAGCPAHAAPHPVFRELDREYDAVVREAADAALGCGRADRVLPALSGSAARHPLDEGLQALLVRALAATGRRAQALEVFRATAARLTDELSVDPGPELIAAARRAAVPDPAETPAAPNPAAVPPPTPAPLPLRPAQLPPAIPVFTGRTTELTHLRALLTTPPTPSDTPTPRLTTHGPADSGGPAAVLADPGTPYAPSADPGGPAALLADSGTPSAPAADPGASFAPSADPAASFAPSAGRTPVIGVIGGPAGVGKTALAVRLAHDVADRFPDGQLYVNLRGFDPSAPPLSPQAALRGFLDALGVPAARMPDGLDAQAALYRALLAGRRLLVLLDNARDADQVRPLLPGAPGCPVLVTSRARLTGLLRADGARPLTLDVLTPAEARSALALRLGVARVSAEPDAVREIVSLTAGLPLAVAMVAARAATFPAFALATLAEQLRAAHGGLEAFRDSDPATDVHAVFSWSYEALGIAAARLFRLLGLHPGPEFTVPTAAALAGEPVARTRILLAELADAHLLAERAPGRYACHDLLRAYAGELVHATDSAGERRAAVRRLLDHCLHTAHAAALLFDAPTSVITPVAPAEPALPSVRPQPLADESAALAWLTSERPVLLGALRLAVDHGLDAHVWQFAWTLERFHERCCHWPEYLALQRTALAAARRLDDPVALAQTHRALGRACMMLRLDDEALGHLRASLDESARDVDQRAQSHISLWALRTRQGRHADALDELAPALGLYEASGARRGQADVLVATAWGQACLGDGRRALTLAHRGLALFQELGIRLAEGYTWDAIGHVHAQLGAHERSVTCYQRALALFREVGDLYNEACVRDRLGDARLAAGHPGDALGAWRRARDAFRDFDPVAAAEVQRKIDRHRPPPPPAALVTAPFTSQAHFVHCVLPKLPPPSSGQESP